jgi:ABC-type phosphate transport system substrate-binding protein
MTLALPIRILVAAALAAGARGDELRVIANPSVAVNEISVGELRAVFLGTRTSLRQAGPVKPVLGREHACLRNFASSYLGKSVAALETYYRSLIFAGKGGFPVGFYSGEEVVAYVARTPGAIGFVREPIPPGPVKTLRVIGTP